MKAFVAIFVLALSLSVFAAEDTQSPCDPTGGDMANTLCDSSSVEIAYNTWTTVQLTSSQDKNHACFSYSPMATDDIDSDDVSVVIAIRPGGDDDDYPGNPTNVQANLLITTDNNVYSAIGCAAVQDDEDPYVMDYHCYPKSMLTSNKGYVIVTPASNAVSKPTEVDIFLGFDDTPPGQCNAGAVDDGSLKTWEIGLIVLGCLAVVCIIGAVAVGGFVFYKKKKASETNYEMFDDA